VYSRHATLKFRSNQSTQQSREFVGHWYLIHTKIRQETVALQNLERQGYTCFYPTLMAEKVRRKALTLVEEPMFPRYLFIQLDTGLASQSWAPIRSTLGVSRLVKFGQDPAKVDPAIIEALQATQAQGAPVVRRQFSPGDALHVTDGPFKGIEAIYQATDGEGRVIILFELMSKPVQMTIEPTQVKKAETV
jgi:transcriptional antiterminator RfaH